MGVKIYISGISGNKEVKKRQQRVQMIMDSRNISYEVVDITEPGKEADKDFMQNNSKSMGATVSDLNPRHPLPPQIFNDDTYCGDYDQFDMANEIDELDVFLKLAPGKSDSTDVPKEEEKVEEEKPVKLDNGTVEEEETQDNNGTTEESVEEELSADIAA